ncbi:DUF1330 domain-containing protein [Paracoccus mutanolyticus]
MCRRQDRRADRRQGDWLPSRLVIIGFDSFERAKAWGASKSEHAMASAIVDAAEVGWHCPPVIVGFKQFRLRRESVRRNRIESAPIATWSSRP